MPTDSFGWIGYLIQQYGTMFLQGTGTTMLIAIFGTFAGFGIGLLVAIVRTIPIEPKSSILKKVLMKIVRFILIAYIEIFRGTPMMVQAMVIFYGSAIMFGLDMSSLVAALFIISINTGAYLAEVVRGGIISVDKGQAEAAHSIGMTHWQTMTSVILPQAIRNIMPAIGNEFVINIKDSSVLSIISVSELFFVTQSAAGTYYRFFESFAIACGIYFVLTFTVTRILLAVEKRMDGPSNYALYLGQDKEMGGVVYMKGKE
jgi:putative lysine transport system permease protein